MELIIHIRKSNSKSLWKGDFHGNHIIIANTSWANLLKFGQALKREELEIQEEEEEEEV